MHHTFELKSPNLPQTCIMGYFQLVLKMEAIDLDLQGDFGPFDPELQEIWLLCMITHHRIGLKSPNLHQTCILGYSYLVLKMGSLSLTLKFILAILWPCNNLKCIWARINKFAPNMHLGIISADIEIGCHWLTSMVLWPFRLRIPRNSIQCSSYIYWSWLANGCLFIPLCSCLLFGVALFLPSGWFPLSFACFCGWFSI